MQDGGDDGRHCGIDYWFHFWFGQHYALRCWSKWCHEDPRTIYAWIWCDLWFLHVHRKYYPIRHHIPTSSRGLCTIPPTTIGYVETTIPTIISCG